MYTVYAIYNKSAGKINIGQTKDLARRLAEHNGELPNSSRYTKRYHGTWELIYSEMFDTRRSALNREKQLKSYQGRKFLKQFIPG